MPRVKIDADGFEPRAVALPGARPTITRRSRRRPTAVFYLSRRRTGDDGSSLSTTSKERKEEKVLDGVTATPSRPTARSSLYARGKEYGIADAKAGPEPATKLDLDRLEMKIDPRDEWAQMFERRLAHLCATGSTTRRCTASTGTLMKRALRRAGAVRRPPRRPRLHLRRAGRRAQRRPRLRRLRATAAGADASRGGLLGCEIAADPSGCFRIAKIFPGENWDEAFRSPLTEPGVDVNEGDFILAVDGVDLTTARQLLPPAGEQGEPDGVAPRQRPADRARRARA